MKLRYKQYKNLKKLKKKKNIYINNNLFIFEISYRI